MIQGTHIILYSSDPEADRAFFRDVLELPNVDVGGGWLIFGLPPSESAFHPAGPGAGNGKHEFHLMVDDIGKFVAWMEEIEVPCSAIHEQPWGRLIDITLPGGGALGVYEPRHERPPAAG